MDVLVIPGVFVAGIAVGLVWSPDRKLALPESRPCSCECHCASPSPARVSEGAWFGLKEVFFLVLTFVVILLAWWVTQTVQAQIQAPAYAKGKGRRGGAPLQIRDGADVSR